MEGITNLGALPRGRVPLIGHVSMRDPRMEKKRSGDDDAIPPPPGSAA